MELNDPCQKHDLESMSVAAFFFSVAGHRLLWHFQRDGVVGTLRSATALVLRRVAGRRTPLPRSSGATNPRSLQTPKVVLPALNLQPGDWVEVKPMEEILQTLDSRGCSKGLTFMPGMAEYCGRRARVFKRVERMLVEPTCEVRNVKNTFLLEQAICPGLGQRCDRACFYFWREVWLRKVDSLTSEQR